jgi:hypothetical protein
MLTHGEERALLQAENARLRNALEIAQRGLAAARDAGFIDASRIIAEVNAPMAAKPIAPEPSPLGIWLKGVFGR